MISNTKFSVVVYTVAGCEACNIMKRLVKQAITEDDGIRVMTEEIGTDKDGQLRQRRLAIKDFPTTVLWKDSKDAECTIPMVEIIGTAPVTEIRRKFLQYIN